MDQDQEKVFEPTPTEIAAEEAEGKRGPIIATLQIRVTIRDEVDGPDDRPAAPTNAEAAHLVEAAFRTAGYSQVNATAEKV